MDTRQIDEKAIFNAARQIADAAAREDFLAKACGSDESAIEHIRALLHVHDQAPSFLESPVPGLEEDATIIQPIAVRPGTTIGPYKLLQQIGEGGMGVVFMAEQTKPIQRIVALKIIKPGMDTRQVVARFEAERQALALMDHPNIARVLDAGTTGEGARDEDRGSSEEATSNLAPCSSFLAPTTGRPYFVMDLVKGVPITKYCDEKHFSLRERLELFLPVCQAVQHAHQKGIIHRDIKPTNVLVADYDGRPVPKVIDFGVAKATAQKLSERTMFTEFGQVIGTIEYMSPEQATFNQLDVDTRSDVYSLGVLLYELLTGSTPFERQRLREAAFDEMLRIIREEDPPKPSTRLNASDTLPAIAANRHTEPARLSKDVSGELDWIVMRALEKDRNRRYQTANALAEDVQRYLLDQPVTACPPSASYRFRKFIRRNKAGATLAAAVLSFLVLTGGGIGWAVRDRAAREAFFAREQADRQVALEKGVRAALDDVKEWHRRENWTDAAAAVKRAEGLLAAGTAQPELERSVKEWRTDLDTVARLEEIRLVYQTNERLSLDARPAALADYQQEFRSIGIDIDALSSDEAAARIRARPIGKQLIAALEDWTQVRHMPARAEGQLQSTDTPAWQQRPLVVARAADDDEFCNRVRDAWLASGPTEIAALARLPEVMHLPPSTLDLLDRRVKDRDVAIELLTRAHYAHAEDFRINLLLASRLLDVEGADVRKLYKRKELRPPAQIAVPAVAYANAAVALQPDNPWAWLVLGQALEHAGRLEESNIAHRKSIDLKPEFFGAYIELSRNLYQLGELDASLAAAKRAIELNPKIPGAHVNKSIVLYEQGQIDEAIAAVREAIRIDPKFSPAHGNLGTILCELRQYDEAIAEFQLALKLHPDDADDYSSLGRALTRRGGVGDLDDAIAACQKAIELAPDHAVAYSNLGIALRAEGKLPDAVSALHKATELRPDDATAYCELGVTLRQLGRIDEAIEAHRKAINIDPEIPCSYINLGAILLDRKEFEAALEVFRTVAHLKPKDATSHSNLGITLNELGRFDEAISECRIAIELEPKSAAAHRSLGNVLRANNQFESAIAELHRAIELQRDYVDAYCDLGEALEDHGQVKEAIDASRTAIELDPKCVSAYNNLASALLTLEKPEEAAEALRKAIELDPKQAVPHSNLGMVLLSLNRLDEALEEYRKAIDCDPKNASNHTGLAEVLQLQGKRSEAIVELKKAVAITPDIDVYRNLASALSNERRFEEAIDAYRKIIALKPDDISAYVDLGGHLQAVGQLKEAIEACQRAIQLQPTNGDAHNNLGNALKKSKRLEEAVAEYKRAAELMPDYPGAMINVAQTLDELGKHEEAAAAFRKALQLKLNDVAMCNAVAWTMATSLKTDEHHPAEAVAFAARATELAPQEGSVWNTLGVARYRNAEWGKAIEALEKSMNLRAGGDSSDWFFLAMAYWQQGDKEKARTWCDKAVEWQKRNAPDDKELARFSTEAAKVLGIAETPPATSK